MSYRLFGSLVVTVDGEDLRLSQRRGRNVLAMLLASHGHPLSAERLTDQLWAGQPPSRGTSALQVVISQLRAVVEPRRPPRAPATHLISSSAGYALRASDDSVDVWCFEAEARRALAASPLECVMSSAAALAWWQGMPYADCAETDLVQAEVTRLLQLRLAMIEARADALLHLGHPGMVASELTELVEQHPFRERLWSQLAISQFQTLRQADALATLRTVRERLADELGVDPSTELRTLEFAILNQSPELTAPPAVPLATEPRPSPSVPATRPELIGRTTELATMTGAIDRLRAGHGGSMIISGDAGIGKSRLAAAAITYATKHGVAVAAGRCHEADVAPAYWPWLPVLRKLVTPDSPPEVLALLDAAAERQLAESGAATLRSYDAVGRLLDEASQRQPLLVVLEDLHWADASSLRLLAFIVDTLAANVLLLCTRRTVEASAPEALKTALAALARNGAERIRLEGLDIDDVSSLLAVEVGPHPRPLADAIAERTAGNPFFVIEFARLLRSRMITDPELINDLAIPEGIRDVLRLRLQRLPATASAVLAVAAVRGTIDPQLITTVSEVATADVFGALDAALAAGLLTERDGRYRFSHALVRETIYRDLPVGERVRLHAAVAEALAGGLSVDPEIRTELAHHYWLAAPLDSRYAVEAVRHLRAAAQLADIRHAYVESTGLWGQAAAASTLIGAADPLDRCRLLVAQAAAEIRIGAFAGARDHVGEAIGIARDAQRWDLVGEAALAIGNVGAWRWRDDGVADDEIIEALTECVEHLPEGTLAAQVLGSLQMEYLTARRPAEADVCGRASVEMARAAGDSAVLLRVLMMRALGTWGPGTYHERIALGEEMLTLPLAGELEVSALWQYGSALLQAGRTSDADAVIERCQAAAARLRHTGADVPLGWWRFMRAISRDDPAAKELGDAALDLHRRTSVVSLEELTGIHAIRTAPVGSEVPPDVVASPAVRRNPAFRSEVAYGLLESGDLETAVRLLGHEPATDAPDFAALASDCLQTAVYAAAQLLPQTRVCLARIQPWSGDVVIWGSADHLGAVDFFVAQAVLALGDRDAAQAYAAAAVDLCVRVGNRPWERRARSLLAELGPAPGEFSGLHKPEKSPP